MFVAGQAWAAGAVVYGWEVAALDPSPGAATQEAAATDPLEPLPFRLERQHRSLFAVVMADAPPQPRPTDHPAALASPPAAPEGQADSAEATRRVEQGNVFGRAPVVAAKKAPPKSDPLARSKLYRRH